MSTFFAGFLCRFVLLWQWSALHSKGQQPEVAVGVYEAPPVPWFVEKGSFIEAKRIVFFAGLEGSGHHFWEANFEAAGTAGLAVKACPLAQALYTQENSISSCSKSAVYDRSLVNAKSWLANFVRDGAGSARASLYLVNPPIKQCGKTGQMSYPNYGGNDKAIQYVNMRLLAQLAEEAGADLRIVVLLRDAKSLLTSALRRNFGSTPVREARMLINGAYAIYAMLAMIDSRFVECFKYEGIEARDISQVERVASHLFSGASARAKLLGIYNETTNFHEASRSHLDDDLSNQVGELVAELAAVTQAIRDSYCPHLQ